MSTLYITEYQSMPVSAGGVVTAAGNEPNITEQHVTIGGASTASAPFNINTHFVMIETDSICSLNFGTAPVAVTTAHRMAANETRFYGIQQPGISVAVIANT